ncbi:helix-turn-helix transcriptional regulator [Rhodomicrobium vannielii]|uniref:helix-turn-helix transcriptional regulator n=1 Tax=Rhodomicrobium vannielii TaxID=1069 RepID=UPI003CC91430
MNEVARSIGLSSGFFNRAFRAAIGKTPHDYIVDCRIAAARCSIVGTDTHLADIAVACGFSSQAHMTTIFRKRLGITPALLRKHRSHIGVLAVIQNASRCDARTDP